MSTSTDRWTCPHPDCHGKTVVIDGSPDDVAAAIAACQTRHAREHRAAAAVAERIRWPNGRRRAS